MTVQSAVVVSYADVRDSIAIARSHGEKFFEQIVWQVENETWNVLGYGSWEQMREAEYADMGVVAPRADQPALVSRLRARGLTQKQVADTVGVSERTVRNLEPAELPVDAKPVVNARGQERPAAYRPRGDTEMYRVLDDVGVSESFADMSSRVHGRRLDPAALIVDAVAEFPDLGYFVETGRERDVAPMADDLRRFRDRGELDERLDTLRRSIDLDRSKRDGTYIPALAAPASHCPTCTCNRGAIHG